MNSFCLKLGLHIECKWTFFFFFHKPQFVKGLTSQLKCLWDMGNLFKTFFFNIKIQRTTKKQQTNSLTLTHCKRRDGYNTDIREKSFIFVLEWEEQWMPNFLRYIKFIFPPLFFFLSFFYKYKLCCPKAILWVEHSACHDFTIDNRGQNN